MPMSQETAARSSEPRNEAIVDPATIARCATQPGSGSTVHDSGDAHVPADSRKAPFKERVVGAALKTRGTLLGKPELKETGQKVFDGELDLHEAREAVHQK
ncbi:hypothetical protein BDZ89DRAFT_1063016 [Hymenopellis radicata]|nr:hypothetical protein BDZ89DRAFT_1063016 [Hymenopellis radicata]